MIVVHVTHEAVEKIGGIGTVIAGLMTSQAYRDNVSRTILVGPMFPSDPAANRRIGMGGRLIYSSLDSVVTPSWRQKFHPIERSHDVQITYGHRPITAACTGETVEAEVLLVNVFHGNRDRLNVFKRRLFDNFAIASDEFEKVWDFEQYVRLAEPAFEALQAIGAGGDDDEVVLLSHEYMGIPTALKAVLDGSPRVRTVFYAHEVASVRPVVEMAEGHDTMFYNVLDRALAEGLTLEQVFPSVLKNYKHPLVRAGRYCDHVFAVGELIQRELAVLDKHYQTMDVDLVFNGIPAEAITFEQRMESRHRMQQYAANLLGQAPTWVLTHVARPVLSKGLWRDLRVLDAMEGPLADRGERAVYFMLGTLGGQRRSRDIRQMERTYGWPVTHEHGYPDLVGGEDVLGDMVEAFNAEHTAIQAIFVNQWDWNRSACGERMPAEMTFADIRRGSDVELGLSVYEPFGISQLEPLCFGAICVVSNVCGCVAFARQVTDGAGADENIIEADFLSVPGIETIDDLKAIDIARRDEIETAEGRRLADLLLRQLQDDPDVMAKRLASGYALANRMSWDRVVDDYFLPSLDRVAHA